MKYPRAAAFTALLLMGSTGQAELRIEAVNVGYGECYILQDVSGNKTRWLALVDTGPADQVPHVAEALQRMGATAIDDVFLTHEHSNHSAGLPVLRQRWKVNHLHTRHTLQRTTSPLRRARIVIHVVNPQDPGEDPHEGGLALLVMNHKTSFLFAGDLGVRAQEQVWPIVELLVARRRSYLEVVTWPHHGDELAVSWEKAFAKVPWLLVSTGPNAYGLPRQDRYPLLMKKALRTDQQGTIRLVSDSLRVQREAP